MPLLLKNETVQRLAVSQQALRAAFSMLADPKPIGYQHQSADGAIEFGLIGVSTDLAISACLCEILGMSGIIRKDSGFFVTAQEGLERFRATLLSAIPRLNGLTSGIQNTKGHLKKLESACSGFSVIFTARASALHAGSGTSYDVAYFAGKVLLIS